MVLKRGQVLMVTPSAAFSS